MILGNCKDKSLCRSLISREILTISTELLAGALISRRENNKQYVKKSKEEVFCAGRCFRDAVER